MRHLRALAVLSVAGALGVAPAVAQDNPKLEACQKAPTHACVLDLLWDQMPKVGRDYQAETRLAFIDAALLTGDQALIDLYLQRTEWRNPDALITSYVKLARQKGDRATLVDHADKAISGLRYDWYQLSAIANGLAEVGEMDRARKVADLIPHGNDDSVTALNLHRDVLEQIAFRDPTPVTFADWADRLAADNAWWEDPDIAWLKDAAARAGDVSAFPQELQQRYRADGWKYLRALARLAPEMTASGEAGAQLFRSYVAGWADPRNNDIAEFVIAIAMRAHPDARAAMLAEFDARQPAPTGRIARLRALANDPATVLGPADKGLLGIVSGPYDQSQAARALGTYSREEFLANARAGEGFFSLSRPAVLRAALQQVDDKSFAREIATLMAELGEPRTIDGYDYAQYATEWAMNTCEADLFRLAESRLARRDNLDTVMWSARFDGDPVSVIEYISWDDRVSTAVADALSGYRVIIAKGYCSAG